MNKYNIKEVVNIYRFTCTGYKDENSVIEYHVQPVKAKVTTDYIGSALSYDVGFTVISKTKLDKIIPQSHTMWSLNPDINKYIERLIGYECEKIFYSQIRMNRIRQSIENQDHDNSTRKMVDDTIICTYKMILNSRYGSKGQYGINSIYGGYGGHLIDSKNITNSDEYKQVLKDMDFTTFNPFTMDINDYKTSIENTDM